jgi:pimeloyl-ACP methyl ester carboxylesterase
VPKAQINGWIINYDVEGDGPPVLCIHGGFGGPQSALSPSPPYFAPAVNDGWQRIEYSRRNCGKSEFRQADYTQDDLAAEAAGLLDHLGLEKAIILGDSMGGTIAQSFALNFPERVTALILSETSAHMRDAPFYGPLLGMVKLADEQGADAVFERRRRLLFDPPPFLVPEDTPDWRVARLREMAETSRAAIAAAPEEQVKRIAGGELCNWRAHAGYDTRLRLPELSRHRTLVLHGAADTTVPTDHGRELARNIVGSDFVLVPEGQHGILIWPEAAEALQSWLGEL